MSSYCRRHSDINICSLTTNIKSNPSSECWSVLTRPTFVCGPKKDNSSDHDRRQRGGIKGGWRTVVFYQGAICVFAWGLSATICVLTLHQALSSTAPAVWAREAGATMVNLAREEKTQALCSSSEHLANFILLQEWLHKTVSLQFEMNWRHDITWKLLSFSS